MAARSKVNEIVPEVRCILQKYGITVETLDHAGDCGCGKPDGVNICTTPDQAIMRLLAVIIELLTNIRENESQP